jgi:hypothetical protein
VDVLSVALQLAFFAVFAAAIWRYFKRPGKIELAVVTIFGAIAAIFAISLLDNVAPGISEVLNPLAITLLLVPVARMGPIYVASSVALGALLLRFAVGVLRSDGTRAAMAMFRFSITYLGLLFAAVAVDQLARAG